MPAVAQVVLIDVVDMVYYVGAFIACLHLLDSVRCCTEACRESCMKQLTESDNTDLFDECSEQMSQ